MRQLADMAGVTIGTVSLALRDHPRISAPTRQRIKELAEHYHYQPNRLTQGLISGKTNTIGCILPSVTCTFYARLLRGVLTQALATTYQVITLETGSQLLKTCKAIDMLVGQRVDGILVASEHYAPIPRESVQTMRHHGIVPISLDSTLIEIPIDEVRTNEDELAEMAVGYLHTLGHRVIAYVGTMPGGRLYGRAQAMAHALQRRQLSTAYLVDTQTEHYANFDADAAFNRLLGRQRPPTAVIAWEDRIAAKLIQHARRRGLRIPRDLSVFGCANLDVADLLDPPLTSIEQNPEDMGRQAVSLAIKRIVEMQRDPKSPPESITIPLRIVERASCAPPAVYARVGQG
jgi:LacI family transcriptional regulator